MSKFQLPVRKGTEAFPRQGIIPPKIVVKGYGENTPLASQLVQQFAGRINRFHMKAAQAYAAGIVDQSAMIQVEDDLKIRYQNNQGRETLYVEVNPEKLEREVTEKKEHLGWDWILLEVDTPKITQTYPDFTGGSYTTDSRAMYMARFMYKDGAGSATGVYGEARHNEDIYTTLSGEEPPLLQYPSFLTDYDQIDFYETGDETTTSSLLIDIRKFKQHLVLKIELYAYMSALPVYPENIREEITGSSWRGTWETQYGGYTRLWLGYSTDLNEVLAAYPDVAAENIALNQPSGQIPVMRDYSPGIGGYQNIDEYALDYTNRNLETRPIASGWGGGGPSMTWHNTLRIWEEGETWENLFANGQPLINAAVRPLPQDPRFIGIIEHKAMYWLFKSDGMDIPTLTPIPTPPPLSSGNNFVGPRVQFYSQFYHYKFIYMPNIITAYDPTPVNPVSRATITGTAFRGDPAWAWTFADPNNLNYNYKYLWQIETLYPQRPRLRELAKDVPVVGAVTGNTNDYAPYNLLGTVIFEQKSGGLTFMPAE